MEVQRREWISVGRSKVGAVNENGVTAERRRVDCTGAHDALVGDVNQAPQEERVQITDDKRTQSEVHFEGKEITQMLTAIRGAP